MKRLLVVDDDIDLLEIIQTVFKERGYEVLIISNGEETVKNVEEFSPDIILLDAFIEGSNGAIICSLLKSRPETKHIPVVMFSALANAEEIFEICNADAFVGKPFDINHLAHVIEEQLKTAE